MMVWVTISSRRLSARSAMTPPKSVKTRNGMEPAKPQDEPSLGYVLHPGADVGEEVAAPEEPEVRIAQRLNHARHARGLSDCGAKSFDGGFRSFAIRRFMGQSLLVQNRLLQ
jgi:hypothetical protein